MRVLVTGGTGFLGKQVLEYLDKEDRISHITVLSRKRRSHPSPKIELVQCDLTDPTALSRLDQKVDAILHLAGRYNLSDSYGTNYINNVVATQHVHSWAQEESRKTPIPIHYASTYAVGIGLTTRPLTEEALKVLPPKHHPYALSKAIAEDLLLKGPLLQGPVGGRGWRGGGGTQQYLI